MHASSGRTYNIYFNPPKVEGKDIYIHIYIYIYIQFHYSRLLSSHLHAQAEDLFTL
jgi:hypothetical protein